MSQTHNPGFPRIGLKRELKFATERYWKGQISGEELEETAAEIRRENWKRQIEAGIDRIPVGDFSLYDHVLDMTVMLGHVPQRFKPDDDLSELDRYFRMARGRSRHGTPVAACEMTKWFDTNYH
ncbi:MAG: 5-methyltetrahydropteroyltriglutamate--homocysteine S-methyltransferase, partial [Spirochaetia bacterium]